MPRRMIWLGLSSMVTTSRTSRISQRVLEDLLASNQRFELFGGAVQDKADVRVFLCRFGNAGNHNGGTGIATHGVHGNHDATRKIGGGLSW